MASIKVSVHDILAAVRGLDGAGLVAGRIARRAHSRRGALDGCGHVRLAHAADELLDRWESGLDDLVADAADLSSLLRDAVQAYGWTEQAVVASVSCAAAETAR